MSNGDQNDHELVEDHKKVSFVQVSERERPSNLGDCLLWVIVYSLYIYIENTMILDGKHIYPL